MRHACEGLFRQHMCPTKPILKLILSAAEAAFRWQIVLCVLCSLSELRIPSSVLSSMAAAFHPSFKVAYQLVQGWAAGCGLLAVNLGLLGDSILAVMLASIVASFPSGVSFSASALVQRFFEVCSSCNTACVLRRLQ